MMRFPSAAERVPLTVAFEPEDDGERWTRNFGGRRFSSHQSRGAGRNEHLLVERFGVLSFAMALVVKPDRLHLIPRRWSAFGVPMPRWLLPHGARFEPETSGRFHFDFEIPHPQL